MPTLRKHAVVVTATLAALLVVALTLQSGPTPAPQPELPTPPGVRPSTPDAGAVAHSNILAPTTVEVGRNQVGVATPADAPSAHSSGPSSPLLRRVNRIAERRQLDDDAKARLAQLVADFEQERSAVLRSGNSSQETQRQLGTLRRTYFSRALSVLGGGQG